MPSEDDLKRRAAAREERKKQQQAAIEAAHTEAKQLIDKQAKQQKAADPLAAENIKPILVEKPKPRTSRAEVVKAERRKNEIQAQKDAAKVPSEFDAEHVLKSWNGLETPPLSVLNAMAREHDKAIRDDARDVANAAGRAAYETAVGKQTNKRNRHSKIREQIAAAALMKQAAAKK